VYATEALLVNNFHERLRFPGSPFSPKSTANEFNYTEGRTDVVVVDENDNLIAFEMKLEKWREALHQAYRNASFAHYSYVVVPETTARLAFRRQHEFKRRGVGLCSVGKNGVQIEISARRSDPLRPWITAHAMRHAGWRANVAAKIPSHSG